MYMYSTSSQDSSHIPDEFWGECSQTVTCLINRSPCPLLKAKHLFNKVSLKIISTRAIPSIFLGYPYAHKDSESINIESQNIFVSRDVIFHENIFPFKCPSNLLFLLPPNLLHLQIHHFVDIISTIVTPIVSNPIPEIRFVPLQPSNETDCSPETFAQIIFHL